MARRKQTKWLKPEGSRYRLPDYYYDPSKVYDWAGDPEAVRSAKDEYIRLRKTAMQRLRSIKKAGFAWTDGYKTFEEYLRPASKLTTPADLAVGLQNLVEFFEKPQKTTIRGIRENINKHIEAFQARGIDFISTNEDFHLFTEFLNMRIQLGLAEMYDSEQIIDLIRDMKDLNIDPEKIKANFEEFLKSSAGGTLRKEYRGAAKDGVEKNSRRKRNTVSTSGETSGKQGGRKKQSAKNDMVTLNQIAAFDIETTRLKPEDFPELSAPEKIRGEWVETRRNEQSIMYIWTLCLHEKCMIIGRTWDEFTAMIDGWNEYLVQNDYRLVIWVHNLSYEFQFLTGIHKFTREDVMAVKSRKVLACTWGNIEFRCSYLHSNMNLDTFTKKMHAEHTKLSGKEFDYTKIRFPWTEMTQNELAYCTNDTQGLCEALANEMQADGDTLDTIPRTSTGYVRRDVRNAIRSNKELVYKIRAIFPDTDVYTYLREAFRGGNTHANRHYAGKVLHNVISADRSSSYPDVQCNNLFPMGEFKKLGMSTVERLLTMHERGTATLARISISNCHLRHISDGCPYIPRDKCRNILGGIYDNGRVIAADYLELTVTDIDLQIIVDHYTGDYTVISGYYSTYGKLPPEMVSVLCDLYHKKTELKNVAGQELIYAKSKAKLNSVYGMTAQNPAKPEVYFDGEWGEDALDVGEALADAQRNAFLTYAWGVWTTAWARYHLQCGIDLVGTRFVYCDTDSVKYLETNVLPDWTPYNNDRIAASKKSGAWAVDPSGEAHYMGVFEPDGKYHTFATLGAKKYAYTDENGKTHVTIAGVSKKEGGPELDDGDEYGKGLDRFVNTNPGFLFRKAGGAELMYNDHPAITSLTVDGHILPITANVVIRDSTYQLGITAEYDKLLREITKEKH